MKINTIFARPRSRTHQEWRELADRYFEAETTQKEELELKHFALTRAAQSPEFDDLRSVLSYFAYEKENRKVRQFHFSPQKWAAVILLLIGCGIGVGKSQFFHSADCYIAYIHGEKQTDADQVMQQMHHVMAGIYDETADLTMENQLKEMFESTQE